MRPSQKKSRLAFFLTLLLLALPASAQTETTEVSAPASARPVAESSPPPPPVESEESDRLSFMADDRPALKDEAPSAFGLLARTVGALLLIVGLVFGTGWGLKRYGGARFASPRADAPALSVISTVTLGDRRSLAVVRFGARTLLVGSTAQSITLLAEEEADEPSVTMTTPPVRSVADMLKQDAGESFAEELDIAHERLDQRGRA